MTEPVEGKAMAAVATRDAGKTPLTVENVQEAVVKALATQVPAAAAFAAWQAGTSLKGATDSAWASILHSEQSPRERLLTRRLQRARALGRITTADHAEGQGEGLIRPQQL